MTSTHHQQEIFLDKPKVSLFAFHLCRELTQDTSSDAEEIWSNLAEVGKQLKIEELQKLPEKITESASRLEDKSILAGDADRQDLLAEGSIELDYPAMDDLLGFTGGIYPVRLHDTYFIDLTICYQKDRFGLDDLAEVNLDSFLSPSQIKASLGQTILFFSQITEPNQNTVDNARKILSELFAYSESSIENSFLLRGKGIFLGGNIYEFTENNSDPRSNNHVLIWLADDARTVEEEAKGNYYYPLIDLLCSQKKMEFAYYQARRQYKKGESYYRQIEPIVQQFSRWEDDKEEKLQQELNSLIAKKPNSRKNKLLQSKIADNSTSIVLQDRVTAYLEKYNYLSLEAMLQRLFQQQLEQLERWLIQIPEVSVNYNRCLRDIKSQLTTIEINSQNFENRLTILQKLDPERDDLSFWERFFTVESHRFQQQIN